MASHRFSILLWEDFEGYFTACPIESAFDSFAGVGRTASEALFQLKEFLSYHYDKHPWAAEPDFEDARLIHFKVEVRPEYRFKETTDYRPRTNIYPVESPIALRVACVYGRQRDGLRVCVMPLLGIQFYYYDEKTLKELATTYVQEGMKGMTPQQLSRFLPPKSHTLDELVVNVARNVRHLNFGPSLETLTSIAEPLGERSLRRQFSAAWERDAEVKDLAQRIGREKANVILVGDTGIGKTTVLVNAVREVERHNATSGEDDESLDRQKEKRRFWLTSGARIISGMQYLGQWQARCEQLVGELSKIGGALCVSSLLDLILAGGRDPNAGVAAFLLPYLQRGELQLVGEATLGELDACRRLLPGFVGLFQILDLQPFNRQQATAILSRAAESFRRNYRVESAASLPDLVHRLFQRFAPYQAFPGKAVTFLHAAFERAELERRAMISSDDLVQQFVRQTGLPEFMLRDETPLEPVDVLAYFERRVIGQADACRVAADIVTTFKAGLNDPQRPVGVLLFCGPTGVGKTQLAKALSEYFFGHGEERDRLVRLDMSEYGNAYAAERLITDARGEPSDLIKRVRQQPFVVVLLDEIEKADAAVFDALLNVFDEGRITDRYGRATSFRSAVIVMTSNLGADKGAGVGFDSRVSRDFTSEAFDFFRPEFFNRIDAVVGFRSLDETSVLEITRKELAEISEREGLGVAGTKLIWTERLLHHLAQTGFDPRYGARPLQRAIERTLVAPLARFLLEHPQEKGGTIRADFTETGVLFERLS